MNIFDFIHSKLIEIELKNLIKIFLSINNLLNLYKKYFRI